MFVSENAVNAAADDLIQDFEIGPLHSRSSIREIMPHAIEIMAEHGMPFRRSLAIVIAKRAQSAWIEMIHSIK